MDSKKQTLVIFRILLHKSCLPFPILLPYQLDFFCLHFQEVAELAYGRSDRYLVISLWDQPLMALL